MRRSFLFASLSILLLVTSTPAIAADGRPSHKKNAQVAANAILISPLDLKLRQPAPRLGKPNPRFELAPGVRNFEGTKLFKQPVWGEKPFTGRIKKPAVQFEYEFGPY